jgi:cardiolipin synthase
VRYLTLANQLTLLRVMLIPAFVLLIVYGHLGAALAVFLIAGVTDAFDGLIARLTSHPTSFGAWLDPMADKLLLVTVFVESAWMGLAPWWLTAAVVARDVSIALGALAYKVLIGPLRGRPLVSSKINTLMQLLYPVAMLVHAAVQFPPQDILEALAIVVLITTVISGVNYMALFTRRAWDAPARSP